MLICSSYDFYTFLYLLDCPTIPDPMYGQVNITGTQLGQIAIFRCDHGYRLVGQASLVCETGGQWNNAPPACQLIGMSELRIRESI